MAFNLGLVSGQINYYQSPVDGDPCHAMVKHSQLGSQILNQRSVLLGEEPGNRIVLACLGYYLVHLARSFKKEMNF